jgi:hypothetical protein
MSFSLIHCSQPILHANQLNLRPIGYSGNSEYDLVNYDCCHNVSSVTPLWVTARGHVEEDCCLFVLLWSIMITLHACVLFEWWEWNITCYVVIKVLSLTLLFNPFCFFIMVVFITIVLFSHQICCRDIRTIILLANSPKLLLWRSLPSSPDSRLRVPVIIAWWLPFIFFVCFLFCFLNELHWVIIDIGLYFS